MIIDFHTHCFPDELADRAISALTAGIDEIFTPVTDAKVSGLWLICGKAVSTFPSYSRS